MPARVDRTHSLVYMSSLQDIRMNLRKVWTFLSNELDSKHVFQPGGLDIAIAQGNALGKVRKNIAACRAAISTFDLMNFGIRTYGSPTGCNIGVHPTQGVALGYCNVEPSGLEHIV